QSYFDYVRRDGISSSFSVRTGDFDYQYRHPAIGRHELSLTMGNRWISDESQPTRITSFIPAGRRYTMQQFTLEDDVTIFRDRLVATAAGRFERNTFSGWNEQPTARVLYTPSARHTFWGAWSQSVRTPARGELDIDGLGAVLPGNPLPLAITIHPVDLLN